MKKIGIALLCIPLLTIVVSLSIHTIVLNRFIHQEVVKKVKHRNKQNTKNTEVHIIGTVHFETDSIKRHHLYDYLDRISPSIILYEGDSSAVKRIVKRRDYFTQLMNFFKRRKEMEKAVALKYLRNNPNCCLLPYEWELRNTFHRKHQLNKNSKKLLNALIGLYQKNQLTDQQAASVIQFLRLNKADTKTFREGTITAVNSAFSDSIIKQRQLYVYKTLPEIAKNRPELAHYSDFIPIHMAYWDIRNKAMVQNILKQIQQHPNEVIAVFNGYSHRYYLIQELKKYEGQYKFSLKGI
ncbi:hypothetical protein [Spongiimicrobium salis]|uniref:hypothetical protein n=1 Tax=Spongiimicrobium salis TaxID=1667022 RepID=UPI00374D50A1